PALLEVLRANLLTETQHEILHVSIYSIAHLRHIVRTRERFMQAMNGNATKQSFRQGQRPQVRELGSATGDLSEEEEHFGPEVEAIALTCWNCGASDHRYQECLDWRPYAEVDLLGKQVRGLMDTGASISCIGGSLAANIVKDTSKYKHIHASVSTADGNQQAIVGRIIQNRSQKRLSDFRIQCKQEKQAILESIVNSTKDWRPYAEVDLLGKQVRGLMDTGASISCIGGSLAANIVKDTSKYKHIHASVSTADGNQQAIVGRISTSITFRGEC
ncbi:hypothetical protein KR084_007570, partial [Drosophila pseudotakahashii]